MVAHPAYQRGYGGKFYGVGDGSNERKDAVGKLVDLGGTVNFQGARVDVVLEVGHCGDVTRDAYGLDGAWKLVLTVKVLDVDIGINAGGKGVEHDNHVYFELGCRNRVVEDSCIEG